MGSDLGIIWDLLEKFILQMEFAFLKAYTTRSLEGHASVLQDFPLGRGVELSEEAKI